MFRNIVLAEKFFFFTNVKNVKKCSVLNFRKRVFRPTQPEFASSKLTVETLEQGVR